VRLDVLVVGLFAVSVAAGCSKPVAPVATSSDAAHVSGASNLCDAGGGAASRSFRVRLRFVGSIVTLDRAFRPRVDRHAEFYIVAPLAGTTQIDTVPAYSVLKQVQWRRVRPRIGLDVSEVSDEIPLIRGAAGRESLQVFAPGMHRITLQAPARAGGGTVTVQFFAGFVPGTWWAGPDPELWPRSSDGDGRAVDVTDWSHFTTVPAWPPDGRPFFGPDSFRYIPSQRRPVRGAVERRTFYETYGNRIYARSEGDTIHANGWVVLYNGGYDKDSPYVPKVDPADPALPPGFASSPDIYPVLVPQGLVGSPTGFRIRIITKLADGTIARPSESMLYPNFEPTSVFRNPRLAGYWPALLPGKAYAVVRSEDSDGLAEPPILDPVGLADRVDAGGGTPTDRLQRRKILTFYVRPPAPGGLAEAAMSGGRTTPGVPTRY